MSVYDNDLALVTINLLLLWVGYGWLFPRVRAFDMRALSRYDLVVSSTSVGAAAVLFYGSEIEFGFGVFHANWFWFALVSYVVLEIPFVFWYARRYDIF